VVELRQQLKQLQAAEVSVDARRMDIEQCGGKFEITFLDVY